MIKNSKRLQIATSQALKTSAYQIWHKRKTRLWEDNLIEYIKKTGYPHTAVAVQWDIKAVDLTNILKKRGVENEI